MSGKCWWWQWRRHHGGRMWCEWAAYWGWNEKTHIPIKPQNPPRYGQHSPYQFNFQSQFYKYCHTNFHFLFQSPCRNDARQWGLVGETMIKQIDRFYGGGRREEMVYQISEICSSHGSLNSSHFHFHSHFNPTTTSPLFLLHTITNRLYFLWHCIIVHVFLFLRKHFIFKAFLEI